MTANSQQAAIPISAEVIFHRNPRCTAREQESHYLIYNSTTDELHLISYTGYLIYSLCDGERSFEEIYNLLTLRFMEDPAFVRERISNFLSMLLERGILTTGK